LPGYGLDGYNGFNESAIIAIDHERSRNKLYRILHVKNVEAPVELLSTTVWEHGVPEVADIDSDLLNDLSGYYMLVTRMNYTIKSFTTDITAGQMIPPERAEHVKKMVAAYNNDFSTLKKEDIIGLKDKIGKEIARLSDLRNQIEANEASGR